MSRLEHYRVHQKVPIKENLLIFQKLIKHITQNFAHKLPCHMYATVLSYVLISITLTKLCCFKSSNPTVLMLSKTFKLLSTLRMSVSYELKKNNFSVRVKVESVLQRPLRITSKLF